MKRFDGKTAKLKGEVTVIAIEESGVLLDIEKRCYYDLNGTAFFLARRLENGCQYESLKAELVSEFNVDQETARQDLDNFILDLAGKNLLTIGENNTEYGRALEVKRGLKPYQSPVLEYRQELIVASSGTTVTR